MSADRNKAFLQERELQLAQQQFLQAISAGLVGARDRMGNLLQEGDYVFYRPEFDLIFKVLEVKPVLDVNQPVGLVKITLQADVPITMAANQAQMRFMLVSRKAVADGESNDAAEIAPPADAPTEELPPVTEPAPEIEIEP